MRQERNLCGGRYQLWFEHTKSCCIVFAICSALLNLKNYSFSQLPYSRTFTNSYPLNLFINVSDPVPFIESSGFFLSHNVNLLQIVWDARCRLYTDRTRHLSQACQTQFLAHLCYTVNRASFAPYSQYDRLRAGGKQT